MTPRALLGLLLALLPALAAWGADELVSSARTPYLLTRLPGTPTTAVILMPGGRGILNPRVETGRIVLGAEGNFLIRSRALFADSGTVAASTDATSSPDRLLGVVSDLEARFPGIAVYVIGTSRSTEATMALARPLDGRVAGFVHSSSMNAIADFDPRGARSRHLIVLHVRDACRVTQPANGIAAARKFGTALIEMDGGRSVGPDCEAYAYHGYNGVEPQTIERIKAWMSRR